MLKNWKIISILCLISSLARFVLDSYLPSLPAISQYFNISDTAVQTTLTIYLAGFGISQLIYGPLSDRYGRKVVLIFGLSIFLLGNLLCVFANTLEFLLLGRLLGGIGAGACGVLNRAIASDCFQGPDFSKAWSYTTTILVITLSLAPILGGYIQELFGWHGNFITTSSFVGIALIVIIKYLPETHHKNTQTSSNMAHVFRNYYFILKNKHFLLSTLCYTLVFSGLIAYFQVSPLLLIQQLELSPSQYGWSSLLIAFGYIFGGVVVNRFSHHFTNWQMLIFGSLICIFGGLFMLGSYLWEYTNLIFILLPATIYVIGARIVIPNALANSLIGTRHLGGTSSALIGSIQMTGSAIVSTLIAHFSHITALALSLFLIILALLTLISAQALKPMPRLSYPLRIKF